MAPFDSGMAARVRAAAADAIAKHHLPGISIGVVRGDDLVFCEGFGYADIEAKTPMSPDRRQRIASITKTMVGLCVMALVDEGRITLDDGVSSLLPDVAFRGDASGVTVRRLLTHTSGIGEAPTMERLREFVNPDREAAEKPGDFASLYTDGIVVEAEPGTKFAYCNNGYALLGEIVERTEKAPLAGVMQRRIFGPLGMTETDILDQNDERITACYHRAPNEDTRGQLERAGIPVKDEPSVDGHNIKGKFTAEFNQGMRAAGGVQSTIPDMARYASALLRRGGGIVRPETFDAMTSRQVGDRDTLVGWGLAFARSPLSVAGEAPSSWRTFIGHGGAYFGGWNSHIDVLADENLAVVQHMNVMMDDSAAVFRSVLRAVLGVEQHAYAAQAADKDVLGAAPGIYELPMPGPLTNFRPQTRVGRVEVTRDGDALALKSRFGKWKPGVRLLPCDDRDSGFFAVQTGEDDAAYVAFDRGSDGAVTALRFDDLVRMQRRA